MQNHLFFLARFQTAICCVEQKLLLRVKAAEKALQQRPHKPLLTRAQQLKDLKETPEFDILVIGGGATGSGVALDAVSRGMKISFFFLIVSTGPEMMLT